MSSIDTIDIKSMGTKAREAALALALVTTEKKNKALGAMAELIKKNQSKIEVENKKDVAAALEQGLSAALIDRLTLSPSRILAMAEGLMDISKLPDPTGVVLREWTRPNGIVIQQITVPLGVVGMIYESRPNVTAEAAGLCLKSGNAVILRGGKEAYFSNKILVDLISNALAQVDLPEAAVQFLPPQDRQNITVLSQLKGLVDLIIARGSEEMINDIASKATVPVLGHGKGVCHVYIDEAADVEKAIRIAVNAKVQRPGVCNAMECLLVHEHLMWDILPKITDQYKKAGVEIRGDERVAGFIPFAKKADESDWGKEFHDLIVAVKVVDSLQEAIDHINRFGSGHTDSIITENKSAAQLFQKSVDSSCVMVNASTRLHDGSVFGFGSEIGISTNKLHARGTMGLGELTSKKFLVTGSGQIRE